MEDVGAFMTFADCTQRVLEVYGDGQSMHYRKIVEIGLAVGWLAPSERRLEGTLYAQVVAENNRAKKRGEISRFCLDEKGYISLNPAVSSSMEQRIDRHNERVREIILDRLCSVSQEEFEDYLIQLLAQIGFVELEVLGYLAEGDFDMKGLLLVQDAILVRMYIQVRCGKPSVFSSDIRELRDVLDPYERGMLITTGGFAAGAVKEATDPDKSPISLLSGRQLALLLAHYGIGVRHVAPTLFVVDEEDENEPN